MAFRGKSFQSLPISAAARHPWIDGAAPIRIGVPFGHRSRSLGTNWFDPWALKASGAVGSTVFGVLGDKGSGKTALMKSLVPRLMAMQAGSTSDEMRVLIHDRKPEDGEPEFAPITRALGAEPFKLDRAGLVNLFDMGIFAKSADPRFQLGYFAEYLVEHLAGREIDYEEAFALHVGIDLMLRRYPNAISPESLRMILYGLRPMDITRYLENDFDSIRKAWAQKSNFEDDGSFAKRMKMPDAKGLNLSVDDIRAGAGRIAGNLQKLNAGSYGGVFSGDRSMRDVLTSPVVTLDWTGMKPKARALLEAYLMHTRFLALESGDLAMIPHAEFMDEGHEGTKSKMWLRAYAEIEKKARAFHTVIFRATQHITDYLLAGDADSEMRQLASTLVKGTAGWFIGRLETLDAPTIQFLSGLGVSEEDRNALQQFPDGGGSFLFATPNKLAVFFRLNLAPCEIELVQTDSASNRMLERQLITPNDSGGE